MLHLQCKCKVRVVGGTTPGPAATLASLVLGGKGHLRELRSLGRRLLPRRAAATERREVGLRAALEQLRVQLYG